MGFIDKAVSKIRQARCSLGQCRRQRRLVRWPNRRSTTGRSVAHQNLIAPFLAIKHSIRTCDQTKIRLDRLYRLGGGSEVRRQRTPLRRQQGGVISLVQITAYSLSGTGVRINAYVPA